MKFFKFVFDDAHIQEIELSAISAFSYNINIRNLYATSKVIFKDVTKVFFNSIFIGQKVTVIVYDTEKTQNTSITKNEMRVLAFQKIMGSARDIIDTLEVNLVSSWYFESIPKTLQYFGTVSQIVQNTLSRDFEKLGFKFDISTTSDTARARYQLAERSQDFLKRILKYGYIDKLPVYLYTDARAQICLHGASEFMNQTAFITAVPQEGLVMKENVHSEESQLTKILRLRDYKINSNVASSASKINSVFTTSHFATSENLTTSSTLNSAESNNATNAKINAQVKKTTQPKTQYLGWNLTPQDAYAISIRESFEKTCDTFQLVGIIDGYPIDTLTLGSLLRLELPFEKIKNTTTGEDVNLAEGGYFITSIQYTYQNNMPQTTFTASQVKY